MYSHSLYRAACLVSDLPIHSTVFVSGISSEKRCSLEGRNGLQVKGDVHILQVRAVIVIIINEHLRYIKIISNWKNVPCWTWIRLFRCINNTAHKKKKKKKKRFSHWTFVAWIYCCYNYKSVTVKECEGLKHEKESRWRHTQTIWDGDWFGLVCIFPSTSVSARQNQLFSARKFLSENNNKKNNDI